MKKSSTRLLVCALLALFVVGVGLGSGVVVAPGAGDSAPSDGQYESSTDVEIDRQLAAANETVRVIVWFENRADARTDRTPPERQPSERQESARPAIAEKSGVTIERQFWLIDAMSITIDTDRTDVSEIAAAEGVVSVQPDFEVETEHATTASASSYQPSTTSPDVTYGVDQINADDVWHEFGTKGAGVNVAVLDTGVELPHDDLELHTTDPNDPTYPGGWAEFDSNGNEIAGSEPHDTDSHGTHVSGTVAGGDASGTAIGVAPETQLMHAKVMDPWGYYSQIVAGMEWAIENDVDVISMSLGSGGYDDAWIAPIRNAEAHDVVVVASAGNTGEGYSSSPGNDYDSIGAGATNEHLEVADFSSGELIDTQEDWDDPPAAWPDEYIVPDIVAPGEDVLSADIDGGYRYASGTSMAAPHVAGAVALIQSATDERHSPDEIKEALRETAWKPDGWDGTMEAEASLDGADSRYGHGIIDAYAAIQYLAGDQALFDVSDATLDENTILEGETVTVTATVENTGNAEGQFDAELDLTDADGVTETVDTETLSLQPGETETVTLVGSVDESGTYTTAVSGEPAGELTVERPATFELSSGSLSDDTVVEGDSIGVSATVENVGDREETFTAELYVDDALESETDVSVSGGESETISFSYEPPEAGAYEISIRGDDGDGDTTATDAGVLTVEEATAEFETSGVTLDPETILEGDSVTVEATVENVGTADGEHETTLYVDGAVRDTETVEIAPGDTETVTFEEAFEDAGTYDLAVDNEHAGELAVLEPADIEVVDADLSDKEISEGDSVDIIATVENAGDEAGTETVELAVDGETVQTKEVAVDGRETETVTFTQPFDEAGEYSISVAGVDAGTLSVLVPADISVVEAELSDDEISEGEATDVTATVENAGDELGTEIVELEVDGVMVQTEEVEIDGGDTEQVAFTEPFEDAGEYSISVAGVDAGTLTVREPADISVVEAELTEDEIDEGESVEVTATVENNGGESGSETVALRVDGETVQSQTIELDVGENETVVFVQAFDDPGEYGIDVDDESAGTLTVEEAIAEFETSGVTLDSETILEGDSVTIEATVENVGTADGEHETTLYIDGTVEATETVAVDAGASTSVTFEKTFAEAGEYELTIDNAAAETLTVDQPATFTVSDASLGESVIDEGESVEVSATVENVGDREGTHEAELLVNGAVEATTDVTIDGGDSTTVTFAQTFEEPGEYAIDVDDEHAGTLTVESVAPAEFEVSNAHLEPETILEGEYTTISADVENVGDQPGTFEAELVVDDDVEDTREVTLDGGESTTVSFERTFSEAGSYDVHVSDAYAAELTVKQRATFDVIHAELSDDAITEGDSVDVTATIENTGDVEGIFEAALIVDGTVEQSADLTVAAHSTETVTFDKTFDDPGEYAIDVDDEFAGTLTVEEATSEFEISDVTLDSETILEGDSVTAEATVENVGTAEGEFDAEFQLTDEEGAIETLDVETVTLQPDETRALSFDGTVDESGIYHAEVSGESAGELAVERPAMFELSDGSMDNDTITEGETVEVTAIVENIGDREGTFTAELVVDDVEVETIEVTVESQKSESVSFDFEPAAAGEYAISIAGNDGDGNRTTTDAGTLTVAEPADLELTDATLIDETILKDETAEIVAKVENHGDQVGTYEAELLIDGELIQTANVTVNGSDSKSITFTETFTDAGEYDVAVDREPAGTLTVEEDATFEISDTDVSETTVYEGESVNASAIVENVGDRQGEFTVEFLVDGLVADTETVTIASDESATVSFTETFAEAGEYDLAIDGDSVDTAAVGTVVVEEQAPAEFEVSNASLVDDVVFEGESVETTAIVENVGDLAGTHTVELVVGDAVLDEQTVELDGGESIEIRLAATVEAAGEYDVSIDGDHAGTLTVETPAAFETHDVTLNTSTVLEGEFVEVTATVENVGTADGEHETTLYVDGTVRDTNTVEIDGGETETVTFVQRFDDAGLYDIEVDNEHVSELEVLEPANLSVVDIELNTTEIVAGENVETTVEVENTGDETGIHTVELAIDGERVDDVVVEVGGGETETVTFVRTFEEPGEYEIDVDNESAGVLTVEEAPATFELTDVEVLDDVIDAGESVEVAGTVVNLGDNAGEFSVELSVEDETATTETVSVDATDEREITVTATIDETGTHAVYLNDIYAGTVEVSEADDDDDSDDSSSSGGGGSTAPGGGGAAGGGGGAVPLPDPSDDDETDETEETSVSVDSTTDGATVSITDGGSTTEPVAVRLDGSVSADHIELQRLDLDMSTEIQEFGLDLTRPTREPQHSPPVTEHEPVGYLQVNRVAIENTDLEQVTFEFTVSADELPANSSSESVILLRYNDGQWQSLPTEYEGSDTYSAVSPGLSEFAIAVQAEDDARPATLDVVDLEVDRANVSVGEQTTATATVENTGEREGTHEVAFTIDGAVVDSEQVTVAPGGNDTVEFSTVFDEAGTYDVHVLDADVPSVSITVDDGSIDSNETTDDQNQAAVSETTETDDSGVATSETDSVAGLVLVGSLLSLLLFSPLLASRSDSLCRLLCGTEEPPETLTAWFQHQSYTSLTLRVGVLAAVYNLFAFSVLELAVVLLLI